MIRGLEDLNNLETAVLNNQWSEAGSKGVSVQQVRELWIEAAEE